ncbi:hypothetical protein FBR05_00375 [Deltaproteobacteria bacterium PRO3]|nr:hypothetical protein [Deltaproteobacteria bacterium PRO3]
MKKCEDQGHDECVYNDQDECPACDALAKLDREHEKVEEAEAEIERLNERIDELKADLREAQSA